MIDKGDAVPHFEIVDVSGERRSYSKIWQRRILVLIALPSTDSESSSSYASGVAARRPEFTQHEAECVMTREALSWLPAPGALVADRWGEVAFATASSNVSALPSAQALLEWVEHVEGRCPECEGEAK